MTSPLRHKFFPLTLLAFALTIPLFASAASNERSEGRNDNSSQRDNSNRDNADRDNQRGNNDARDNDSRKSKGKFNAHQREMVQGYFSTEYRRNRCPPGLAKKNNGCNPPGLVQQWQIGQPLNSNITTYDLTRRLTRQLGEAPSGYGYTRVDNNILMLELGTQLVVDVINGFNR